MRILQVVRELPYGGAETYALLLSRGLAELGHEVSVLTEGGPLENRFSESGIEVAREPDLGRRSLRAVARRIAACGFDIMNAHHYRSARVTHVLHRLTGVPYIMTVHARRSLAMRAVVRYWSDLVLVLSEEIATTLRGPFGVPRDRVRVSFPPVDTYACRPAAPPEDVARRYLREPGGQLILHVSRLTYRKKRPARALVEAMPGLLRRFPGALLLIVGHGEGARDVGAAIERLTGACGQVAVLEGPRPGLADLMNLATVTVGTGLVAREALACACPVVAAGRRGYLGPVNAGNLDAMLAANFGDWGACPEDVSADAVLRGLTEVLSDSARWRGEADELSRRVAAELTPRAAAAEVFEVYREVIERRRADGSQSVVRAGRRAHR